MPALFAPSARQWNGLIAAGLLSLGYALYLRYIIIEQAWVALSCRDGAMTWVCMSRNATIALFKYGIFGWVAFVAAALHLFRPSLALFATGMIAAAFGIVLYNLGLSGVAIAMLILGFARPASETA